MTEAIPLVLFVSKTILAISVIIFLLLEYARSPITPLSVSEGISKTGTVFIFIPICFNDPATKFVFNLTASKAFSLLYSYKSPNDLADKVLGNSL